MRCEQHGSERCCITAECEVRWQRAELDRLRAALERIARGEFPMPDIAREALAETSPADSQTSAEVNRLRAGGGRK